MNDSWDQGFDEPEDERPIVARPAKMLDPRAIPPRPWIYGTYLLRGFVSVLVAAGGVGKSMFAMSTALSCTLGKPLLGHYVHTRTNAWIFNLEDPMEEMDRRLAACRLYHSIDDADLDGALFMNSGRDDPLCIGKVGPDGVSIVYPHKAAIIAQARERGVGVIIVDPFIKSHRLDENRNGDMDAAVTAWAEIASEANCAVLLVHHVRKGPVVDIEAARGGKSLIDGARVGLVMSAMGKEEAESLDISDEDRGRYVRLDDGKANMAPKAASASWFEIKMQPLGNGTPDYPSGDNVGVIVPWMPPSPFEGLSLEACNAALDRIAAGFPDGRLYSPNKRGRNNTRWAGNVLIDDFGIEEGAAARIITAWLKNGVLIPTKFQHDGKELPGVLVEATKRPGH